MFEFIKDKYSARVRNKFWNSIENAEENSTIEIPIKTLKYFNFNYFDRGKMSTPYGMFKYKLK